MADKVKIFKPNHEEPGEMSGDYILLPYGDFYEKTLPILGAKKGDILRFFNGPEYPIGAVTLVSDGKLCDMLCRIRYGIPWQRAYEIWLSYARLEGHGKDILRHDSCIMVCYDKRKSQ